VGFPGHPTVEVPGRHPHLAELVRGIPIDYGGHRDELSLALEGDETTGLRGHVCATAWVLDPAASRILLVRHPVLGWATIGGHLVAGEPPAAGAARELREESGLDLTPLTDTPEVLHPGWFPPGPTGPGHWHHNLGFRFVADPRAPLTPEPGAPMVWFARDQLPEPRVSDIAPVLAQLR
jgi:8-oxo-dGTP pyrophosphatase MutT (NUDIX family)